MKIKNLFNSNSSEKPLNIILQIEEFFWKIQRSATGCKILNSEYDSSTTGTTVRGYLKLRRNCYASYLEQILFWNYLQSIIHFCRKHIDIEYFNCIVTSDWLTIENHKGRDTSWQTFNKISQKSQMAINRPHITKIGTIMWR